MKDVTFHYHNGITGMLEHFNFQIVYSDEMLWRCETKRYNARWIGVGKLRLPLSDNLKTNLL